MEPFLVTLPVPSLRCTATVFEAPSWLVTPPWKVKALRAAQLASGNGGALRVELESEIPVGRGCGSSTADCVAAVRAVADLRGLALRPEEVARLVQRAELASDATMFDLEPVAFLPRTGEVLRRFRGSWPEMKVEIVDLGGPDVATLECPVPSYTAPELKEFAALLQALDEALMAGDAVGLGRVALRSGEIHQRHRPHAQWGPVVESAMGRGAYGVAVAHSGTVAAVLSRAGGTS